MVYRLPSVSVFVFVFVVPEVVLVGIFLGNVEFDRVEPDDLKLGCALFAGDRIALVGVEVNVDFGFAVRTRSYRHSYFLQVSSRRGRALTPGESHRASPL
jgi:hypothetical protein